jgi:hypothetical protein
LVNVTDLTTGLLKVRVKNAEKQLHRAKAAGDSYAIAAALVTLQQVREQLERYSGGMSGD